jgi:FMN phosphatase YigB (HAD superfamily)/DNA-binding XRE family transcriptional regulator
MTNGVDQPGLEKSLGLRLQAARQKAGLTQQDLCQKANLAYSTLAKIERGAIKSPSIFTIQNIADSLGLSLDELLGHRTPASNKHTSKSGIKFVYFDINGCIVRFFNQAFTKLAHQTGLPIDRIESAFWHFNDDANSGQMSLAQFNAAMAQRLGLQSLDWQSYYVEAVEPIKEMQQLLPWAVQNYQVGLLSNIMPGFIKALQAAGKIPSLPYQAVIDSSQVKAIKPEAKIYHLAQAAAGVEPSQILLVDDSRTNLMAAERQGWHVLWFDDYRPAQSVAHIRDSLAF